MPRGLSGVDFVANNKFDRPIPKPTHSSTAPMIGHDRVRPLEEVSTALSPADVFKGFENALSRASRFPFVEAECSLEKKKGFLDRAANKTALRYLIHDQCPVTETAYFTRREIFSGGNGTGTFTVKPSLVVSTFSRVIF